MNPFTEHTKDQGVTYWEHCSFAMGIALRLMSCVSAFALHAVFPFIGIEKHLDLEATATYLQERNDWIERTGEHSMSRSLEQPATLARRITKVCVQTLLLIAG
jgi:hypothetical protein